jgi:4-hydroxy-tetrahydrodipicolinate synthase
LRFIRNKLEPDPVTTESPAAQRPFRGVLAPALTPFRPDLSPDVAAFTAHCRWLLSSQGVDGLAVFGTTSEANSLGIDERMALLEALVEAGIPPSKLMPGTGTCALTDTLRLTRHAVEQGCGGVLMLPPFYYKNVGDDGLYASFARVIEGIGSDALKIYLYHIPPMSQTPLSLTLIGRLLRAYPTAIAGIKDSGGDWANTRAILEQYPTLATFCGSEVFLLDTLRHGGAGTISATANINAPAMRRVVDALAPPASATSAGRSPATPEALQLQLDAVRRCMQAHPTVAGLKAVLAEARRREDWRTVRPPLEPLSAEQGADLVHRLAAIGFDLSGI